MWFLFFAFLFRLEKTNTQEANTRAIRGQTQEWLEVVLLVSLFSARKGVSQQDTPMNSRYNPTV